jgi:hypothetical protein
VTGGGGSADTDDGRRGSAWRWTPRPSRQTLWPSERSPHDRRLRFGGWRGERRLRPAFSFSRRAKIARTRDGPVRLTGCCPRVSAPRAQALWEAPARAVWSQRGPPAPAPRERAQAAPARAAPARAAVPGAGSARSDDRLSAAAPATGTMPREPPVRARGAQRGPAARAPAGGRTALPREAPDAAWELREQLTQPTAAPQGVPAGQGTVGRPRRAGGGPSRRARRVCAEGGCLRDRSPRRRQSRASRRRSTARRTEDRLPARGSSQRDREAPRPSAQAQRRGAHAATSSGRSPARQVADRSSWRKRVRISRSLASRARFSLVRVPFSRRFG